jgi:hypothetical protein
LHPADVPVAHVLPVHYRKLILAQCLRDIMGSDPLSCRPISHGYLIHEILVSLCQVVVDFQDSLARTGSLSYLDFRNADALAESRHQEGLGYLIVGY